MATLTKEDLDKPIIPEKCKDCEYLCISQAVGLDCEYDYGCCVATCRLNHAKHRSDALRGTYVPCLNVIFLNPIYKCKYDKERLANTNYRRKTM